MARLLLVAAVDENLPALQTAVFDYTELLQDDDVTKLSKIVMCYKEDGDVHANDCPFLSGQACDCWAGCA